MLILLLLTFINICSISSFQYTSSFTHFHKNHFVSKFHYQDVFGTNKLYMQQSNNRLSNIFPFSLLRRIRKRLFPSRNAVVVKGLNNVVKDQVIKDKVVSKAAIIPDINPPSVEEEVQVIPPIPIMYTDVAIIGAGIAGLSCGKTLETNQYSNFTIIESCSKVGGRVQSDEIDGYILDRGFQVFLDNYPESIKLFNYSELQLKPFLPGAIIRWDNDFHVVSDPLRRPQDIFPSVISPIGSLLDKIKIGLLTLTIKTDSIPAIFNRSESTTEQYLLDKEVSMSMISRFFKPFYQGIFLSPLQAQSSRMFEFVFKMFSEGSATLPASGMGVIPQQIADYINKDKTKIILNTRVESIITMNNESPSSFSLRTVNQQTNEEVDIHCQKLVIAADPVAAKGLLYMVKKNSNESSYCQDKIAIPKGRGSTCVYFGFDGIPPITDPVLILNGDSSVELEEGDQVVVNDECIINNVCFPSQVSSKYAPEGKSLASITLIGCNQNLSENAIETAVKAQLKDWWGDSVETWKLLKIYRIAYAQPSQNPPYDLQKSILISNNLYCIGDHRDTATLNGAIASGRKAAESILNSI